MVPTLHSVTSLEQPRETMAGADVAVSREGVAAGRFSQGPSSLCWGEVSLKEGCAELPSGCQAGWLDLAYEAEEGFSRTDFFLYH